MNTMKAGVATVDITPPVGGWLQGFAREKPSEGIFERLFAKALVFENGSERCVLVTSDLDAIPPKITRIVRAGVIKKIKGLEPSNIMVTASHTHCGPAVFDTFNDFAVVDKHYIRTLTDKMIEVILQAWENREPVKVGAGTGKAHFNINRRLPTPEGIRFLPNPKGSCDHEVGVIRIDDLEDRPKAILMNFTCHPTVWGELLISPDYPGFAQKAVEDEFKGAVALFTNGACGDIRPCLVKGSAPKTFGGDTPEAVGEVGIELAREVIRIAKKIKTRKNERLGSASQTVRFPLGRPMSVSALKAKIVRQTETIKQMKKENQPYMSILGEKSVLKWAKRTLKLVESKKFKPWVEDEIQLVCIGGVYLVGLPGEILCEIGLSIKKYFDPAKSFILGYANGCIGYVPTPQALIDGGYEPNDSIIGINLPARFSPKVQSVIEKTVKQLHTKVRPEITEG